MSPRILVLILPLFMAFAFGAEALPPAAANAPVQKPVTPLGLVTGAETGTYYAFGKDIASVSQSMGQPVAVVATSGSVENIRLMTEAGKNDSLGIVQSDVLGFLQRSDNENSKRIAASLRLVFPFYQEEVHVLARNNIKTMADLNGKRIVVGLAGSGNIITSINLLSLLNINPAERVQLAPPEGVVAVLSGEADAMIFVGGKPVPLFDHLAELKNAQGGKNAQLLEGVHFLPLNDQRVLNEYAPAEITAKDYPFVKETVPTVAVTAVLVAYDYSSGKNAATIQHCNDLQTVGSAIRQNLDYLKHSGHPKWREVDPERQISGWKRDMCSWRQADLIGMRYQQQLAHREDQKETLLAVIEKGNASLPGLAPAAGRQGVTGISSSAAMGLTPGVLNAQ